MLKNLLLLTSITLATASSYAQQVKPQVISTAGATMVQGNANLSFTVGEIAVKTIGNGVNNIGQGTINLFANILITPVEEVNNDILNIKIYPNPAVDLFYVDVVSDKLDFILLEVFDLSGRQISKEKYAAGNLHIGVNTQSWKPGMYLLIIRDTKGKKLGKYKVLKE